MINIMNIPQIPTAPIENLQNDLHIGFTGDIAKRLQKVRWADEAHTLKVFPEAVDALMAPSSWPRARRTRPTSSCRAAT